MTSISPAAGGIKSIQRGFTYTDNGSTSDVTVNAVDLSKTIVTSSVSNGYIGSPTYVTNATTSSVRLDTTTNIKIYAGWTYSATYSGGPYNAWFLIEYA